MSDPIKVMIVAPFWRISRHVGVRRVERFVRWLSSEGIRVILVRAGADDYSEPTDWGVEISIKDPLNLYHEAEENNKAIPASPSRKPNRFRRLAASFVFNPDPSVVWSMVVVRHPLVGREGEGVGFVISSSPPESSHVAAMALAEKFSARFVMDMRDGWIDDPLNPALRISALKRFISARIERRAVREASAIIVTSNIWKSMLESRLPFASNKIFVLPNGYPPGTVPTEGSNVKRDAFQKIKLLYTGRLSGSRVTQSAEHLLEPVVKAVNHAGVSGEVVFQGWFGAGDREIISKYAPKLEAMGWKVIFSEPVSREKLPFVYAEADGLLLLSSSEAVVPSKLFEYIAYGKPILSVAPISSAVRQLTESLPQVFHCGLPYADADDTSLKRFMESCRNGGCPFVIPEIFTEESQRTLFLRITGMR